MPPRTKKSKNDPQSEFVKSAIEKEMVIEIDGTETGVRSMTIKRWTLRQQFTEGVKLSKVVRGLVAVLSSVGQKVDNFDVSDVLNDQDLTMTILASHAEDIFSLITTALLPNFESLDECKNYVDTEITPQDAFIVLFSLIALNKAVESENSKKKLQSLTETLQGLVKNQ